MSLVKRTLRREAREFLDFLLKIRVQNRGEWAAQRRSRRHYAGNKMNVPSLVGRTKGVAREQHFQLLKTELDAIRDQMNFEAEYQLGRTSTSPFRGEVTTQRRRPMMNKEIRMLIVALSTMIWCKAKNEIAGQLVDYCEEKKYPVPFKLSRNQQAFTWSKREAQAKRRFRETRHDVRKSAQDKVMTARFRLLQPAINTQSKATVRLSLPAAAPQMSRWENMVRDWFLTFKAAQIVRESERTEPEWCCPLCGKPTGPGQLVASEKEPRIVWECENCNMPIAPIEKWAFRATNFNFSQQDEAFMRALSGVGGSLFPFG